MEKKTNIQCEKCGYQWYTRSKLKKVTCPSCNQKTANKTLGKTRVLKEMLVQTRAIIGLEAAIVLIAFVIIAAAFAFMVVNQGLFATERGKAIVQEGLKQASTPLGMDGSMFVRTTVDGKSVDVMMIPLRAFGVKYVAMWQNETVVSLKMGKNAWANIYGGVLYDSVTGETYDPTGAKFDEFVGSTYNATTGHYVNGSYLGASLNTIAVLSIENSNGDESLDSDEKGYLILTFSSADRAPVRSEIVIEIRLEKTAPLSIEFNIPEAMPKDTYVMV